MKNNSMIVIIVALVIGLAGGFFGGMQYQKSQAPSLGQFGNRQQGGLGAGGQRRTGGIGGGRIATSEIISQDDKSITVKLPDGSSKIVLFSNNMTIIQATQAAKTDLKVGEKVGVFGTQNTDGSVTATNIQLNPTVRNVTGGPPKQ